MIKKVSHSHSNSDYEIPGAKFAVACDWTTCDQQCDSSCSIWGYDWSTQFYNASNYYATHGYIWN